MSPLGKRTVATAVIITEQTAQMEGFMFSFTAEHTIPFTKAMKYLY